MNCQSISLSFFNLFFKTAFLRQLEVQFDVNMHSIQTWLSPGWGECLCPITRLVFGDKTPPVSPLEPKQACGLPSLTQNWSHAQVCKCISLVWNGSISTLAYLNQCILIPPFPGFLKWGEWLQSGRENICLGSCIFFVCFNCCFFPESPEEDANASYFSSLVFQLYRVPPGHNSFVMSFPFLPSALGLISIDGKHPQSPSEAKRSCRHFSPLRTWPEAGYSSLHCWQKGCKTPVLVLPHLHKRDVFWPKSSTKDRKSFGYLLGKRST